MRGIHPEVDDQQAGAWGDGLPRLTQQLKVLFRHKYVHDMGQQDRVMPFWQKVFEKITLRDVDLAAQWVTRQSSARDRSSGWQFEQRALQLRIPLQYCSQEGTSPAAKVQHPAVPAEVVHGRQSRGVSGREGPRHLQKRLSAPQR